MESETKSGRLVNVNYHIKVVAKGAQEGTESLMTLLLRGQEGDTSIRYK